jgi:hypothetical protein
VQVNGWMSLFKVGRQTKPWLVMIVGAAAQCNDCTALHCTGHRWVEEASIDIMTRLVSLEESDMLLSRSSALEFHHGEIYT